MYGNILNRIMEKATHPSPKIGMGCTICMWSDRHPATIVHITPKQIHVQKDDFVIVKGSMYDGTAEYCYYQNKSNPVIIFRLTKAKGYRSSDGNGLLVGHREKYHDPSF